MEVRSNSEPIFRTTSLRANAQHKIMHTKGAENFRNIFWKNEREKGKEQERERLKSSNKNKGMTEAGR